MGAGVGIQPAKVQEAVRGKLGECESRVSPILAIGGGQHFVMTLRRNGKRWLQNLGRGWREQLSRKK
jgi:hypothetical protein